MRVKVIVASAVVAVLLTGVVGQAAEWGLKTGTPNLKSAGSLAFGPEGILLVGDTKGATVFAIATGDTSGNPASVNLNVEALNEKIAELLGTKEIRINDLAVNPLSGNVYLSVTKTAGEATSAALVRVGSDGKLSVLSLKKVAFSKVVLPNPPEDKLTGQGRRRRNNRDSSITDLIYFEGKVIVSGLSNEKSASTVREIAFPFADADAGISLEIYHGAHGRYEDYAPVRAFVPININGKPNLLAGFQCTPLVKFPLSSLQSDEKVRGTTVAELGNGNRPLDMIVYKKDGKEFLLMANSRRGVMKISTDDIARKKGITDRVKGTAGQEYETIEELKGVVQLDRLNDSSAVILVKNGEKQNLQTIELP